MWHKNKSSAICTLYTAQRIKFKGMRFVCYCLVATSFVFCGVSFLSAQDVQVLETRADGSVLLGHRQIAFGSAAPEAGAVTVSVNDTLRLQRMDGFGASLTDSSVSLLLQLPSAQRDELMQEMFDPSGPLGVTLLRQPIGASDFSAHGDYSYDDPQGAKPDPSLKHFGTATDSQMLFPLLREALHLNPQLRFMVLPWSAPAWMKDSHTMHDGSLENIYLTVYARYLARTVEAYAAEGLPVFAMALQNEPLNENPSYPTQRMDPVQEAQLAAALQPLLWQGGRNPLLLGYEHNWNNLDYPAKLLAEATQLTPKGAAPLFAGISFHCYAGNESAQLAFLRDHPNNSVWLTECSGINRTGFAEDLLWQAKHLLLGAPLNGARSVLLWNLVLNPHGGPHNGGCGDCRAAFTVEPHAGSWLVHRNVEYYELAHAAPFIHPGAVRVAARAGAAAELETVAFQNPDGTLVLLVLNIAPRETRLTLQWKGQNASYTAPARSLMTFRWGTAAPVVEEGTYRICAASSGDRCLEAVPGSSSLELGEAATEPAMGARQLWTLHRLGDNRFEIRNVATAQSLGIAAGGMLVSLAVDGGHVVPLSLHRQAEGVCLAPGQQPVCVKVAATVTDLHASDLLNLVASLAQ